MVQALARSIKLFHQITEDESMPRLKPLPPETTPELKSHFDFFLGTLGFTPNSVLTMQRKPKMVQAFAQLNAAVMDPEGKVDLGFRRIIGHVVSQVSGCLYCQAHTLLGAHNFGVSEAKLADVWNHGHDAGGAADRSGHTGAGRARLASGEARVLRGVGTNHDIVASA